MVPPPTPESNFPDATGPILFQPREEFSFVDVALILVRRQRMLLAVWLLIVLCTGGMLWSTPPRFESRAVVKIGRSRLSADIKAKRKEQDMLIEPAEVLALRLREEYRFGTELGRQHGSAYLSAAAFDKDADEILTLVARADTAEQARAFLAQVTADLVARHAELAQPARRIMEDRLDAAHREMSRIDQELASFQSSAEVPEGNGPALLAVRKLAESALLGQRSALQKEVVQLQLDLINLQVQPTALITAAQLQPRAVEPRVAWYGILGTAGGLIAGCCAAFVAEFLAQVRRQWHEMLPVLK